MALSFKRLKGLYLCFYLVSLSTLGDELELELGGGILVTSLPEYLGADSNNHYTLPFPYFYYKSESLEIDKNALTGLLWHSGNWHLDISASGKIPVKSDETELRKGMRDLGWIGEIGPSLNYYFSGTPHSDTSVTLAGSLRKAFALDSSIDNIGWTAELSLSTEFLLQQITKLAELKVQTSVSALWGSEKYLDYFYGVDEKYITELRPSYDARAGYSGTTFSFGASWKYRKVWLGAFTRYYWLNGSAQQNSPLVNSNNGWALGLSLAWVFYQK